MKIKNHIIFFSGHLDWVSRLIRVCVGIVVNLGTLYFIEHMSALVFWSLILVSYTLLLEAIWGSGMVHSIVELRKERRKVLQDQSSGDTRMGNGTSPLEA